MSARTARHSFLPGGLSKTGRSQLSNALYHGWQMRTRDGVCAKIPALTGTSTFPVEKLRTVSYPVQEEKGTLWIYIPADEKRFDGTPAVPAPTLPTAVGVKPKMRIKVPVDGPYDEAVIGLGRSGAYAVCASAMVLAAPRRCPRKNQTLSTV